MKEQIRTHVGMAQTHHHQGGPLSLISCVSGREASPLDDNDSVGPVEMKTETKKKRFHPLRNLRRMFRRKSRRSSVTNESYKPETGDGGLFPPAGLDHRSRSTGRLAEEETNQNQTRKDGLAPGLSLSHDSVFAADRADSGHSSSDLENSSLSIPISVPEVRFRAELADAVRRRNRESDEEEEDLGLPRSPCSSPMTADVLGEKPRELGVKSQSSCSEGSLPSMEGSDAELDRSDSKSDFDLSVESQKLSHSAAKHKMAVRPKRNHGAPRGKRKNRRSGTALPATPESNEEATVAGGNLEETETPSSVPIETSTAKTSTGSASPEATPRVVDPQKKSASLPHGAALSSPKVVRSRSNVVSGVCGSTSFRKRNSSETETEDDAAEKSDEAAKIDGDNRVKKDESFFGRLLPRRSGKKKKSDPDSEKDVVKDVSDEEKSGAVFAAKTPCGKGRQVPTAISPSRNVDRRQRVEPLSVAAGFRVVKKEEVSDLARNRMKTYSVSPPRNPWPILSVSGSTSPPAAVWPERSFSPGDEIDGDEWKNARRNAYESNWEENVKRVGGRASPVGRFVKNESSSAKRTRREISPVKARRESSPSRFPTEPAPALREKPPIQKSQSFRNFSAEADGDLFSPKNDGASRDVSRIPVLPNVRDFDGRRLPKENSTTEKPKRFRKDETAAAPLPFPRKSVSLESVGSAPPEPDRGPVPGKASSSESFGSRFPGSGFVITHEEPEYANLEKVLPVFDSFEKVHHGYENIQIIELVRKEVRSKSLSDGTETDDKFAKRIWTESGVEKKSAKPPILEKPKEPKRDLADEVPEFMRVQLNKVESRNSLPSATAEKTEVAPRIRPKSTLVERRKSELLLTAESEEKNFKPKVVSLKKQTPPAEIISPGRKDSEESKKAEENERGKPKSPIKATSFDKTETVETCEVLLRKKPAASQREDQPELMKVFARRSLKVKEDDEVQPEDVRKSRDSDKENETLESPKEERKRWTKKDSEPEAGKKCQSPVKSEPSKSACTSKGSDRPAAEVTTPLKPQAATRNPVLRKYGRVCSESALGKRAESSSGDEISESTDPSEESGFKRIQQRKAEWEKRMQQAAKQ